ncbi:TauD/TfdA dioxygenase family protein [Euzebya tangerina]|uniref:TauD/TfdA dioxygenase family protein n=1 Tax=Euzebya tangerina TaxID=591198 RepID=UPI00196A6628|nr:TauD/TfdA family dioxygenase [Euzebya tangerina]
MLHLTPMDPFGVRIAVARDDGIPQSLSQLAEEEIDQLRDLLADHGVLVMHDPDLDDQGFATLLRRFGPLIFTAGEAPVPHEPSLNVISNVGRERPPVSRWHTDTSYVSSPPSYTALRAIRVPEQGGETLFSDQAVALDTLDQELSAAVVGRTITHVVTGVDPGEEQERQAVHPIVRPHPRTGRPALYLSTRDRCASVSGLSADAGRGLVDRLLTHATQDHTVLRHRWMPGDVVMWDNARVLHRGDHSDVVGDRVFHRGMVGAQGYRS